MRTEKQIKNYLSMLLNFAVTWISAFYIRKVFLNVLGVEYLGVSGLLQNLLGMLSLVELGVGGSIVYSLYKPLAEGDQKTIHQLIWLYRKLYAGIGIAILALACGVFFFLTDIVPSLKPISNLSAIYFITLAGFVVPYFFSYNSTLFSASQQQYKIQHIQTLFSVLNVLGTLVALYWARNYIILITVTSCISLSTQLCIYYYARKHYPWLKMKPSGQLNKDIVRKIKINVTALCLHNVGFYLMMSCDNLLLGSFINISAVGLYANYQSVLKIARSVLANGLFMAPQAGMGELVATSNKKKIIDVFDEISFFSYWAYGLFALGFYLTSTEVITLWVGQEYVISNLSVLFLTLQFLIHGLRTSSDLIQSSAGIYAVDKYVPLAEIVLNLAISIYMVRYLGMAGIFLGTLISNLLGSTWIKPYIACSYLQASFKIYMLKFLGYGCMFLISYLLCIFCFTIYLPDSLLWGLIYKITAITVLFHFVLWQGTRFYPESGQAIGRLKIVFSHFCRK